MVISENPVAVPRRKRSVPDGHQADLGGIGCRAGATSEIDNCFRFDANRESNMII